ncbi:uncharacterized protein B0T15DRAFT_228248 [Chaetomium strumarium]|uniref:Uncharacterized protein n=1 Tax=Chaetomium strumarium TaxID=1170767 RepID=A0AAJ0M069_9PEZI|nr:hypothetical protein B0T15DRAFT_228248 [Chaetomium strumarium]
MMLCDGLPRAVILQLSRQGMLLRFLFSLRFLSFSIASGLVRWLPPRLDRSSNTLDIYSHLQMASCRLALLGHVPR